MATKSYVHDIKLLPAREVSPLIRTCRWVLLLAGIGYGAIRLKYLRKREVAIKERNDTIVARRRKEYNEFFARQAKEQLDQLAKDVGVTPLAATLEAAHGKH